MDTKEFLNTLKRQFGCEFFTGVPDSQLKELCNYLISEEPENHLICANEGNAVAVAAGNYLATGNIPVVYLQNSGIGNIINPVTSLLSETVYGIPCIFIVGWRGEPNVKDEPQHIFQGEITLDMFKVLNISTIVIDENTSLIDLENQFMSLKDIFKNGKSLAIIVKKNTFQAGPKLKYKNNFLLNREEVIKQISLESSDDILVCTTGKASRELFEIRERAQQSHKYDFLTVGSMGHSSSIALGIAKSKPNKKVWCIDGDGAAIMHMGAMAIIGSLKPKNLVHIILNNEAHETVGGMPTASSSLSITAIAKGCGYPKQIRVETQEQLIQALHHTKTHNDLVLIEVCVGLGSRSDLGRPTTTPKQNKKSFCNYIRG